MLTLYKITDLIVNYVVSLNVGTYKGEKIKEKVDVIGTDVITDDINVWVAKERIVFRLAKRQGQKNSVVNNTV